MTCPNGEIITKELVFDSENYVTDVLTNQVGKYELNISYTLGEMKYTTKKILNISYLPEFDSFTLFEASNLYYLVSQNGQISEDGNLSLNNNDSIVQKYIVDLK